MNRARATQAEKKRRIDLIIQAMIRDISEDHIVEILKKQGMSYRQARRYMEMAYQDLYKEAVEQDPIEVGLILKRAKQMAQITHLKALEEKDNPDGKAIRNSLAAQKGFVAMQKAFKPLKHEPKVQIPENKPQEPSPLQELIRKLNAN